MLGKHHTNTKKQRPESPTVTLTWYTSTRYMNYTRARMHGKGFCYPAGKLYPGGSYRGGKNLVWFACMSHGRAGRWLSVIFRWWNSFWGFPVIRASTHARQIIQSFLPARPKNNNKKVDALNANGKTHLFRNLVWRSNAHTAVRKTSSERKQIYIYI